MRANYRYVKGNPIQTEEATLQLRLWREGCTRQREQHMQGSCGWKELGFFEKPREGQYS